MATDGGPAMYCGGASTTDWRAAGKACGGSGAGAAMAATGAGAATANWVPALRQTPRSTCCVSL